MKHVAAGLCALGLIAWASCQLPPLVPPVPTFEPSPSSITYRLTNVDGRYLRIELLDDEIYREVDGRLMEVEAEGPEVEEIPLHPTATLRDA